MRKARYALGPTLPLEVDEAMTEERHSALVRQFASTHILKPEPVTAQLAGLTGNEYFCMRLAQRVRGGLPKASDDALAAGVAPKLIEQLRTLVAAECERQASMAADVAKIDPSLF